MLSRLNSFALFWSVRVGLQPTGAKWLISTDLSEGALSALMSHAAYDFGLALCLSLFRRVPALHCNPSNNKQSVAYQCLSGNQAQRLRENG